MLRPVLPGVQSAVQIGTWRSQECRVCTYMKKTKNSKCFLIVFHSEMEYIDLEPGVSSEISQTLQRSTYLNNKFS